MKTQLEIQFFLVHSSNSIWIIRALSNPEKWNTQTIIELHVKKYSTWIQNGTLWSAPALTAKHVNLLTLPNAPPNKCGCRLLEGEGVFLAIICWGKDGRASTSPACLRRPGLSTRPIWWSGLRARSPRCVLIWFAFFMTASTRAIKERPIALPKAVREKSATAAARQPVCWVARSWLKKHSAPWQPFRPLTQR